MSKCNDNSCSTDSGSCGSDNSSCTDQENSCPVESTAQKWQSAFCDAMYETKKELLKTRIEKAWGPMLEKQADAVVESMSDYWQGMLAQAKSKCDLREKIKESFCEASKCEATKG